MSSLTPAQFAALPRTTPTAEGQAAAAACAKLKQHQPLPIGPAGLAIPRAASPYRPSIDGPLLTSLVKQARADFGRDAFTDDEMEHVARSLTADIERRMPPEDMVVLKRYGYAIEHPWAHITVLADKYADEIRVRLPAPVTTPSGRTGMHVDLGGRQGSKEPPVPADVVPYCRKVVELRRQRHRLFGQILNAPQRLKATLGTWPKWAQIEREHSAFGAWMAEQRRQAVAP